MVMPRTLMEAIGRLPSAGGRAAAPYMGARGPADVLELAGRTVLVGGDMRPSSPEFIDAFAEGATARGADVVKIGLISTDELYFEVGLGAVADLVEPGLGGHGHSPRQSHLHAVVLRRVVAGSCADSWTCAGSAR
jgi:hypothetical protein